MPLAPMRTSQFLQVGHNNVLSRTMDNIMNGATKLYERSLRWCLAHRVSVILISVVIFVGSLFMVKFIKKEFVPPQDQSNMFIQIKTPIGTSLEVTNDVFKQAEKYALSRGEVERYYAAIGGFGGGEVNTGIMFITLKQPKDRPADPEKGRRLSQQELMPIFRENLKKIPGVEKAIIQDLSLSGFASQRGFPVEFTLLGSNWEKMGELSEQIMERMRKSGYMVDVDSDFLLGQPEIRVAPNREKAAERGVNVASIGNTINAMVGGIRIGKYSKDGRRYDIRLRLANGDRKTPNDITKIWVRK
jgi:HAE1 family hydrophobic/amphiphilic exporter-1